MSKTKEYSVVLRQAVLNSLSKGRTQSIVAKEFGISQQLVSVWTRLHKKRGTLEKNARSDRPRKTTKYEDRIIRRQSVADPKRSALAIRDDLQENYGVNVHVSTVKRRLATVDLNGRRPSRKSMISDKNRKVRLQFAKKYASWTIVDWSKILWSDESKFNLFSSDGIQYVRRPKNKRNDK